MPTTSTQHPHAPQSRYGPTILPLRPQPPIPQSIPYNRSTSTDNYPCTDLSPRRRPRTIAHEIYPVRSSPTQAARHTASPQRVPQLPSTCGKLNPFAPTQRIIHRASGPNFRFHQFTNALGIDTTHGVHVPEGIKYTSTPPQHKLKPTSSSCSLG